MSIFGLSVRGTTAQLGGVSVQPSVLSTGAAATVIQLPSESPKKKSVASSIFKTSPDKLFTEVANDSKTSISFSRYEFGLVKEFSLYKLDNRYNDTLPNPVTKFTPYEELSNISSSRPEILTVSEYKPIYNDDSSMLTPAGEFLNAQVKLMNFRHQSILSLIKDLKKDKDYVEQLDQQEGNFLLHVKNVKSRVQFLQNVQDVIDKTSRLFDLRDPSLRVDAKTLLAQYYRGVYSEIDGAVQQFPLISYAELLSQHGFSKSKIDKFSGTKIFLQILNESKKMMRVGSDELLGVDLSLTSQDSNPVTVNRRLYKDPHHELSTNFFPTFKEIVDAQIHTSDERLTELINQLETSFVYLDSAFSSSTSEEITYCKKINTFTREFNYSKTLADPVVVELLKQYGYSISETIGNQQLFDSVCGQVGNRITDDKTSVNSNALSSISSKIDNNISVLTFEADYLENDEGAIYTPGAAYYFKSTVKPSNSGFSLINTTELAKKLNSMVDRYVDFVGKFNFLPRVNNKQVTENASNFLVADNTTLVNSLYDIFVENSGVVKSDVYNDPLTSLLRSAATDPRLRANLLIYIYCIADVAHDGLAKVTYTGQNLLSEGSTTHAKNVKVSATLDKVVNSCVLRYRIFSGDNTGANQLLKDLKNPNQKSLLSRIISFVVQVNELYSKDNKAISANGRTRYSLLSNTAIIALALQLVADSAKRYADYAIPNNPAININPIYQQSTSPIFGSVQTTLKQIITPTLSKTLAASTNLRSSATTSFPLTGLNNPPVATQRFVSKTPLKQFIETRLQREDELLIKTVLAPLNIVKTCRDSVEQMVLFMQKDDSVQTLNDIQRVVGDSRLVELLGERAQIQILSDVVDDVLTRVNPEATDNSDVTDSVDVLALTNSSVGSDDLKIYDDSFITDKTSNLIMAAMKDSSFNTQHGSNIRLISVGLPHGFSSKLKNKFKITQFSEQISSKIKQNDVITFDIYRVDVRYPDLIFKPLTKIFELSRFASRNESHYKAVTLGDRLNSVLDSVPTKDYSNFSTPTRGYGSEKLVQDEDYNFLSQEDKFAMTRNHVMSYLLEIYFRVMTGIPLSERELYVIDPDDSDVPTPFVVNAMLKRAAEKVFEVPVKPDLNMDLTKYTYNASKANFQIENTANNKLIKSVFKSAAEVVGTKLYEQIVSTAAAASDTAKKRTVYTDAEHTSKRLMSPKLFERIFFMTVDPDDYEIDYVETMKSKIGKSTFSKLKEAGEIEEKNESTGLSTRSIFKLKELKSTQQEMTFEKYFITVKQYVPSSRKS